jgi:hypothetical protein
MQFKREYFFDVNKFTPRNFMQFYISLKKNTSELEGCNVYEIVFSARCLFSSYVNFPFIFTSLYETAIVQSSWGKNNLSTIFT